MPTELTFTILKFGLLIALWVFVWLAVKSLRHDITALSPRKSRAHRTRAKRAQRAKRTKLPQDKPHYPPTGNLPVQSTTPTMLVVIDGPLAGSSAPLGSQPVTIGRSTSNTVVLDDEFVSSHHARIYFDAITQAWAIEDLGSTNGTMLHNHRIQEPTILPVREPVRIGATMFELR